LYRIRVINTKMEVQQKKKKKEKKIRQHVETEGVPHVNIDKIKQRVINPYL